MQYRRLPTGTLTENADTFGKVALLGKTFEFKFVVAGSIPSLHLYLAIEGAGLVRAQLDFEGFSPLCAGATPKTE
jgi:hypothetical protein